MLCDKLKNFSTQTRIIIKRSRIILRNEEFHEDEIAFNRTASFLLVQFREFPLSHAISPSRDLELLVAYSKYLKLTVNSIPST